MLESFTDNVRALHRAMTDFYAPLDPSNLGIRALEITSMNVEMISRGFGAKVEYDIQRGGSRIRKGFKTSLRIDRRGNVIKKDGEMFYDLALIGDWVVKHRLAAVIMPREEFEAVFRTTPYKGKGL